MYYLQYNDQTNETILILQNKLQGKKEKQFMFTHVKICLHYQAREVTRIVRHSSSLEIEEDEMNEKLDILIQLLGCSKHQRAVDAKQKINQVKFVDL